ncbi:MAG: substrate-binding domain-containing protein [Lachnospiraceae bacterium]|jgi:ribose transport system substrate-binding protein|nr:substrate-binding domain-containing protein [Lachnospiraceae bacterium]
MKKSLAILLAMGLVLGMTGCGSSQKPADNEPPAESTEPSQEAEAPADTDAETEKEIKVGVAMKTQDGAYFTALATHVKEYCEAEGWSVSILNADSDTLKEAENMDTFITQGYDLIFMDPYETDGCIEAINKANAAGIPVICMDNSCGEAAENVTTVYSDNLQNGREVGLWIGANSFDASETISSVLIAGQKGNTVGQERRTGVICGVIEARSGCSEEEAWEAAKAMEADLINSGSAKNEDANFEILGIGWGDWNADGGLSAAEDLLVANKNINFLFGENDAMVMGAMTAIDNAGLSEQVVLAAAADGQKEAYELIKNGTPYKATGENNPQVVAETAVGIAKEILLEGADPTGYDQYTTTPANCINPDNVDEFYNPEALF